MAFIISLGGLSLLLLIGLFLRLRVAVLRKLLLPVSLIGGFVGLAAGPYALDWIPANTVSSWSQYPSVLINFVFAGLFMGVTLPTPRVLVDLGGPLFRFGLVTALGQYLVAFVLVSLVLTPVFGTPLLFACLIEVGFAGGHGTAAAMADVFTDLGFEAGGSLAQMSATVGVVVGVVLGMALIGWGVRRGVTTEVGPDSSELTEAVERDETGLIPPGDRLPIAVGTVRSSVLEPFTLHVMALSVAVLLGWVMQLGIRSLHPALAGFPLFPLAMIGGMGVQFVAEKTGAARYFDRGSFQRIMGLSLDLLVVAAIASLRLDLVAQNLAPFTVLMVAGIAWTLLTFLLLAPRMLGGHWFEKGIVMYGTQTAVTAVGLMLLRTVDPENRTPAAKAFAARAMVSSPLVGGGLVTATMPLALIGFGLPKVMATTALVMLIAYFWPSTRRGPARSVGV